MGFDITFPLGWASGLSRKGFQVRGHLYILKIQACNMIGLQCAKHIYKNKHSVISSVILFHKKFINSILKWSNEY